MAQLPSTVCASVAVMRRKLARIAALIVAASTVLFPWQSEGQAALGSQRRQATRAELESAVAASEGVAASTADAKAKERLLQGAAALRQRLKNGDFGPGDRILLSVLGDSALSDTFTVQMDQRLNLPGMPAVSLRGVLDSELGDHLTRHIGNYVKDPRVTATSLVRVAVMGMIGKPGFLTVSTDLMLSDVMMLAGGPTPGSAFADAKVTRGGKTLLAKREFAEAVQRGRSVGDIQLRDGDEIFIPTANPQSRSVQTWLPLLSASMGIFWLIRGTQRRVP